jgi:hypothetical protein
MKKDLQYAQAVIAVIKKEGFLNYAQIERGVLKHMKIKKITGLGIRDTMLEMMRRGMLEFDSPSKGRPKTALKTHKVIIRTEEVIEPKDVAGAKGSKAKSEVKRKDSPSKEKKSTDTKTTQKRKVGRPRTRV